MTDYSVERSAMIESQIRPNNVTDPRLLAALHSTPREVYVPPSQRSLAYMDGPLRVEAPRDGQPARYLLAPMLFARLVQLASIRKTDKVLDVAPATGYSTAILAALAKEVIALECDAGLSALAGDALTSEGVKNTRLVAGEIEAGVPADAPFDAILINGRIHAAPDKLLEQLTDGGRLVAVVGDDTVSHAVIYVRLHGTVHTSREFECGSPPLPGLSREDAFVF